MLHSVKTLEEFAIGATDGPIGRVKDFYFDDQAWVIRYLVVDTAKWLGGREVLISPYSIGTPNWSARVLPVTVTKAQISNSPGIETDKPISRRFEKSYLGFYGYPYYWGATGLWGDDGYPGTLLGDIGESDYRGYLRSPSDDDVDPHLRSCGAVKGYHVHAGDGDIGHIQGFIVDDYTWSLRYLIVTTANWWTGHDVLISPEWIQEISWPESKVFTKLTRQAIKDAPAYNGTADLNRVAEAALYSHYDRDGYWQAKRNRAAA